MLDDQPDSNHQMGTGGSQIGHSWWKGHVFGPSALVCYDKELSFQSDQKKLKCSPDSPVECSWSLTDDPVKSCRVWSCVWGEVLAWSTQKENYIRGFFFRLNTFIILIEDSLPTKKSSSQPISWINSKEALLQLGGSKPSNVNDMQRWDLSLPSIPVGVKDFCQCTMCIL